jgi:KUP system potassium uptake protein
LFLAANLTKLVHGAWLPLLIAIAILTVLTTWQRGRTIVTARREQAEGPLAPFVEQLHDQEMPVQRVPGTAVFLNRGRTTVPLALRANVEHNHSLHEHVLIVAVETVPVPTVDSAGSAVIDALEHRDDGIAHVSIPVGYMETADIPSVLKAIPADEFESALDIDHASYFLSTIDLSAADTGQRSAPDSMPGWRQRIFLATTALTADAAEYFNLPRDRTVIIGSRIAL